MFIEIETASIINLDLVDRVDFHSNGTATVFAGGVVLAADSRVLWRYFKHEEVRKNHFVTVPQG